MKSFGTGLFLVCGLFTVECHGVWYNLFVQNPSTSMELFKEQPAECIHEKSVLFYVSLDPPRIDQAVLVVTSTFNKTLVLCAQSDVCHECSLLRVMELRNGENKTVLIDTTHPVVLSVSFSSPELSELVCSNFCCIRHLYRCSIVVDCDKVPIQDLGTPDQSVLDDNTSTEMVIPPKARLRSLDTFRGISLLMMIFVNYAGGHYWFFHHAAWDGLTVADLVFPWFVFIMGSSIAVAFKNQLSRNVSRKELFLKVIRRSLVLFALGLIVGNRIKKGRKVSLCSLRIPGVLQRLAVSYLVVAVTEIIFVQETNVHQIPYITVQPHDPEGILGSLTSIFLCFLGLQGLIAGTLCRFGQFNGWIPVNKNLWLVIDPGMNSIVVYLCSEVFSIYFPFQFSVNHTHLAQLAMALWGTIIWCVMAAILYYKKIFIAI
ncbi:hypothetical protein LSH36_543g05022 [Paralvinella palmiformis]|uniref:Heparan-alpha-glucosaminide N-acetyltransferase catalytic domain-containing protein n=1 Tax=Paralvinella palmiformis TaxID=53620 RepID=A0AAD9MXD5_9ANNE|nr:hypothetical protein LSH36_543g05022 [Paralvinella palmiformis]